MDIGTIYLLILVLTAAIGIAFFRAFALRQYVRAVAFLLAFVALYYGAQPYRRALPFEPINIRR
jgi:hypothetical protein